MLPDASAVGHDGHQQRVPGKVFTVLAERVAAKDSVLELTEHLLASRVDHLAAGELGAPAAVVCHQLVGHVQRGRVLSHDELGAHAEAVDRTAGSQKRGDAVFVEARRREDLDLLETGGVEPCTGRLGQLIEVAGIQPTARTSKRLPSRLANSMT